MKEWSTPQGGSVGWPGTGVQGIAPDAKRSEWMKSTYMAKTIWGTLRADSFKPLFSSGKDVSVLTAMAFDLDKKIAEAVANLAGLDILAVAYKNTGKRRKEGVPIVDRIEAFAFLATVAMPV